MYRQNVHRTFETKVYRKSELVMLLWLETDIKSSFKIKINIRKSSFSNLVLELENSSLLFWRRVYARMLFLSGKHYKSKLHLIVPSISDCGLAPSLQQLPNQTNNFCSFPLCLTFPPFYFSTFNFLAKNKSWSKTAVTNFFILPNSLHDLESQRVIWFVAKHRIWGSFNAAFFRKCFQDGWIWWPR